MGPGAAIRVMKRAQSTQNQLIAIEKAQILYQQKLDAAFQKVDRKLLIPIVKLKQEELLAMNPPRLPEILNVIQKATKAITDLLQSTRQ
jgi:hypothetical protein